MMEYYKDDSVTILHGNAFEIIDEIVADVVITDPPYSSQTHDGARSGFIEQNKISFGCFSLDDHRRWMSAAK